MKQLIICSLLLISNASFGQNDFTGIAKYKLTVLGSTDGHTDSMSIIFDKERVMVILYLPGENKISEKIFIDDFKEKKSYQVDPEKHTYQADSLKTANAYDF